MAKYEAYITAKWQEQGLSQVLVVRDRGATVEYAGFVVDTWCLGVKDAMAGEMGQSELADLIGGLFPDGFESIEPNCARKLVEGAVAYAERLGFAPHRDYRKARRVLSGLDADRCLQQFEYGKDGRPFYVQGAESDEAADRVLSRLDTVLGEDGYTYVVRDDEDDPAENEGDDADIFTSRDYLMEFLHGEPSSVPRFFALSGVITAAILTPASPRVPQMTDVLNLIWPDKKWSSRTALQEFLGHLQTYWNFIAGHIEDACDDEADRNDQWMVDAWDDDCPDGIREDAFNVGACVEWCGGFMRALDAWSQAWSPILNRPDLEEPLALIRAYAEFMAAGNQERIASALERGRTLDASVLAVARAARPELR